VSGAAVGPPYGAAGRPRVALAVETPGRRGDLRLVLVAEMSLEALVESLDGLAGPSEEVFLVRPDCTTLRDGTGPVALPGQACAHRLPAARRAGTIEAGGRRYLGAYAPVPLLGWGVVARQDEEHALLPMARLRSQIFFWAAIGVVLALLLAGVVARDLSRRIEVLAGHSQALARGELGHRVTVQSRDELGLLAESLNTTAKEIEAQHEKIEAQNREITAWNTELEQRVAQKTDDLARAQEAVLRSRRLAGLGVLGAGVAHEISNPLASTLGFVQLALHDKDLPEKHRQGLLEAEKSALRIREIVHELRKLADNESEPAFGQVDLNDTAQRAAHMVVSQLIEHEISLELNLATKLPPVRGNGEQLIEATLHLIHNARQAITGQGRITLRTSHTGGQLVSIEVIDTGAGIPEELLDRVFDPFFTTKGDWESRGLGLSVVNKIAEEHGGHLVLRSEVGKGTTATVTLPASAASRHLE
jgi:signal transduction histidine kinase